MIAYWIIAAVAVQRLGELAWARRNTGRLMTRGAVEVGRGQYPFVVALHVCWLAAIILFLPRPTPIYAIPLAFFVALQLMRFWVLVSLGPFFTTRVITLPGATLVQKGPYRFVRHPNYLVVAGEILTLPLVFGEIGVAIVFSLLNAAVLAWRIGIEDRALALRR